MALQSPLPPQFWPNTAPLDWPGPHVPDLPTQAMPEVVFDTQVVETGIRFGWLRAHSCPCTFAFNGKYGNPNPGCLTCGGRGIYWDPPLDFNGLLTYMHTSSAPDEPGATTNEWMGHMLEGMPTLTVPFNGTGCEAQVWRYGSSFDAFVEYDAVTRYNTVFVSGNAPGAPQLLPYQWGVGIISVASYATGTNMISPVASGNWAYSAGAVTLDPTLYPTGTAYTVEYTASPVFVAFRPAGGVPHARPFAEGRTRIPRRFHLQVADAWLRDRFSGELPNSGIVPLGPRK